MLNQTVLDLYHSSPKDLIYDPGHIFPSLGLSNPISTMKKGISERVSLHDLKVLSWLFSFPELRVEVLVGLPTGVSRDVPVYVIREHSLLSLEADI